MGSLLDTFSVGTGSKEWHIFKGKGVILRQSESGKASLVSLDYEGHELTFWLPKACVEMLDESTLGYVIPDDLKMDVVDASEHKKSRFTVGMLKEAVEAREWDRPNKDKSKYSKPFTQAKPLSEDIPF
jgi:hypothetical protein